jgi:hypothetical protein
VKHSLMLACKQRPADNCGGSYQNEWRQVFVSPRCMVGLLGSWECRIPVYGVKGAGAATSQCAEPVVQHLGVHSLRLACWPCCSGNASSI